MAIEAKLVACRKSKDGGEVITLALHPTDDLTVIKDAIIGDDFMVIFTPKINGTGQ